MALAARSSRAGAASDGRIPCPVCRQQIHPVAGRCKHCKTDLVKLREQHGVRAPRLAPAVLGVAPPPQVAFAPAPNVAAPVPTASAPVPPSSQTLLDPPPYFTPQVLPQVAVPPPADLIAAPMPYLGDATLTDLPAQRRPRWPIIVAIVAGVAIVICILLLVLDKPGAKSSRTTNGVGVGTDSMDTQVTPPAPIDPGSPGDPWGAAPDPNTPPPANPPDLQPDPYQPPAPVPPPSTFSGTVPKAEEFYSSMLGLICEKAKQCGGGTSSMMDSLCDGAAAFGDLLGEQARSGQCTYDETAAKRCLEAIDSFSCRAGGTMDLDKLMGAGDCMTALSCPFSP